eukprot:2669702-Rhodomonas_salina.1
MAADLDNDIIAIHTKPGGYNGHRTYLFSAVARPTHALVLTPAMLLRALGDVRLYCYALSGTDLGLRCYAMSGTNLGYAATHDRY